MLPKSRILKQLAYTLGTVAPLSVVACGAEPTETMEPESFSNSADALGTEVLSCSDSGNTGYDATTRQLDIDINGTPSVVMSVINGYLSVNGFACVDAADAPLKTTAVKKITITGTDAASEKVVIDSLGGVFGSSILSSKGGIVVDLGAGGTDEFSLRGSTGVDKYKAGTDATDNYFEISGDKNADIRVIGAEATVIALGDGNDTFSALGGALVATHLHTAPITSLNAITDNLTIYGGEGNDTIAGGAGDDTIDGGAGDDTFQTDIVADGADVISGGLGTDKVDYSLREATLMVVLDGTASSGEWDTFTTVEGDTIAADVENIVGGKTDDVLIGNESSNKIQGGDGNDWIDGGAANADCTLDVDSLEGENGDDNFDQGATADCGDVIVGGAGVDTVLYWLRSTAVTAAIDNKVGDGDPTASMGAGEGDNIKTDVENIWGGDGADVLTGSAYANEIHGGDGDDTINGAAGNDTLYGDGGNDTLNGEAGDDTFDEGTGGLGDDIINGGIGFDKVTYVGRTAALTVTMCVDTSTLKGASMSADPACSDADGDPLLTEQDRIINIDHLIGGDGADTLTGSSGAEMIEGGAGNDILSGGAGADTLYGDDNDDVLNGDDGDDYLDGGTGDDTLRGGDGTTDNAQGDVCISDAADVTNAAVECEL